MIILKHYAFHYTFNLFGVTGGKPHQVKLRGDNAKMGL